MPKTEQKDNQLQVTAVQCGSQRVIGFKIVTDQKNAQNDSSRLWRERFKPLMEGFFPYPSPHFGVCRSLEGPGGLFEYWASMPFYLNNAALPEGAEAMVVPAGWYAECLLIKPEDLPRAYHQIIEKWLPVQNEFEADLKAPSYELYPPDYYQTGLLTYYFPLKKKKWVKT